MRRKAKLSNLVVALAGLLLIALILRHYWPPSRSLAFPRGAIVVGVDASYAPFALDDGESLQGLDIDLANAVAGEIGLPLRFMNIGHYGLYDALISGEVELLISALRIDPNRMEDVRYSKPYFDNGLVLVMPPNSALPDAHALAGKGVAFEYASSADSFIRAWKAQGIQLERLPYELPQYALDSLRLGRADAALVDATTYLLYQSEQVNWQSERRYVTHVPFAIAVRADNVDAWKLVNGALSALKGKAELAKIIDKWFQAN